MTDSFGYTRIRYNGPRVGVTFIGPGAIQDYLSERRKAPLVVQFGWQFETRLFTINNGTSGLVEWVLLVGGTEQGLFLPSATMLLGMRSGMQGYEFGIGPSLSVSGIGMAFAVGGSLKSGKMYFPINLAVVPSAYKKNGIQGEGPTGVRVSLLIGFNTRVR